MVMLKQDIIKLCIDMAVFWKGLRKEIEAIPDDDVVAVINAWTDYFPDNHEVHVLP